ncbi:MAG TPA: HAMP domain-containing histidine kinase [Clostridiales bacterium]|nr:HAMP domain-containing histidine kinase [Clostridiales bacterium]
MMNKLTHSFAAKVTAVFLFVITVLVFVCGVLGIYFLIEYDFYKSSTESARHRIFEEITRRYADQVYYNYFFVYKNKSYNLQEYINDFSEDKTNFLFVMKDETGKVILSSYSNQEVQFSSTYYYEDGNYLYDETENLYVYNKTASYTIDCYVKKTLTADDRYSIAEYWINFAYSARYTVLIVTIVSFIAAIVLFIFLMCSAGRRKGTGDIVLNSIDKTPFDLLLVMLLVIGFIEFVVIFDMHIYDTLGIILLLSFFLILDILLLLMACMSFAVRYKLGGWWKNTIVYRFLHFNYKIMRKIFRGIMYLFQHLSLLWKSILVLFVLSVAEFIIIVGTWHSSEVLLLLWLFGKLIFVPAILYIIINMQQLQIGSQKIASGDLDYRIDTKRLFWEFKHHGENLNNISVGMSKAVDERMKSERFKTELITNVSHDIKTPLTSIINYVSLLKREDIGEGTVKEYINVLDRQSARLKKLIEDLVEASKASTGNIAVNSTRTEVGVLLTQAAGEYEERMRKNGLELILNESKDEIFTMADGSLMWRVFDNLLDNICKYSQPGTRAYLNLERVNNQAVITFRNISKYALNITSEELMERFVRGDSSRTTEGSGLGLSIAKSLVELQSGKLDLIIDGDLFKVILTFNLVP